MSALGAEVIWTRLLSLTFGGTVYTFSVILAVFLVGLGIGSSVGSFLARGLVHPRLALGWCQLLLTAAIAWSAWMIARSLPYWPIDPCLPRNPWHTFQLDLARCLWAILPATCLWGASFPLALAAVAVARPGSRPGSSAVFMPPTPSARSSARSWPACSSSPWLGTQHAQQVLIGIAAVSAVAIFATRSGPATAEWFPQLRRRHRRGWLRSRWPPSSPGTRPPSAGDSSPTAAIWP